MSPAPSHMWPDRETTTYQVAIPTDDWEQWKATVPRDLALYERLHTLLLADTAAGGVLRDDVDGWDDEDERMVRLLASRVLHRARRARSALDNDNPERTREELEAIVDIATELDG